VAKRTFSKYGIDWPLGTSDLTIELYGFRHGRTMDEGGLGKAGHFKEVVHMLWGPANDRMQFIWHPWAGQMLEASCIHKYLAVSGCRNSGKTDFYALWAIVNFLCAPLETKVLVTSTSLIESYQRVWGRIEKYWQAAQHVCGGALPGKLVSSVGIIKFEDPTGEFKTTSLSGVQLIAGEKKKDKEISGKMIGIKQERLFVVADELPELSHAILESAMSNLSGNPTFQLIGIGNPNSIYDPHGVLSTPKNGWGSVTPNDDEWETEKGWHIRFDGTRSPNILAGRTLYRWLPTKEDVASAVHEMNGEDSSAFWRMIKAFWTPYGTTETVISEADIVKFGCEDKTVKWKTRPFAKVAFLDPAYTSGGDRSCAYAAELGEDVDGKWILLFTDYEILVDNVTEKDQPRNFQIAEGFKRFCIERAITADRAALDESGGSGFADIVQSVWSRAVTRVNFGGKASERPISALEKARSCDRYANKVTEIWRVAQEFIRCGQIKGISPDLGRELTSRRMKPAGSKVQVEPKPDMRARTGKSPDIADSALGLLDFVRTKYHFRASVKGSVNTIERAKWKGFLNKMGKLSEVVTLNRAA
jgi:hypothetical protein